MIITTQKLLQLDACPDQIERFRSTFGDQVEVSEETALRAVEVGLEVDRLAQRVLISPAWDKYERIQRDAWVKCKEIRETALSEYRRVKEAAMAKYKSVVSTQINPDEYRRVERAAWIEYDNIEEPARAECKRIEEAAWSEYDRECALAFAAVVREFE